MEGYEQIFRYQVAVTLQPTGAVWRFFVETDSKSKHEMIVANSQDIPFLVDLVCSDSKVYFDVKTGTISSGWNLAGTHSV